MPLLLASSLSVCDRQAIKENDAHGAQPEGHAQDSKKYSLPNLDPGMHQSPINIFTNRTQEKMEQDSFVVHFHDKVTAVENLGHTIQLDFKSGSTISVKDKTYTFKQMHFHTPSEHLIDGNNARHIEPKNERVVKGN